MEYGLLKTVLLLISGGFLIFLAITIVRDNLGDRLNQMAGLLFFTSGLGPLGLAVGRLLAQSGPLPTPIDETWLYSLHWLWELFFPALVIFSVLYPVDRLRQFRSGRVVWLIFVPPLVHVIISLFFRDVSELMAMLNTGFVQEGFFSILLRPIASFLAQLLQGAHTVYRHQETVFGLIYLLYVCSAIVFLETGRRYVSNPRLLQQTKVVVWGFRLALTLYVASWGIDRFPLFQSQAAWRDGLLLLGLVGGAVIFAIAILRFQFLNLQSAFRQSVLYTLSSGLLVGAYLFVGMEAEDRLSQYLGSNATAVSWIVLFVLLLLFQPINNWLDTVIRSMFMRTRADHRNIIERFSRQIISQFDPVHLRAVIEETLKTELLVEEVYFVQFDERLNEFRLLPSEEFPAGYLIDRTDRLLGGINLLDTPTTISALQAYVEASALARELELRRVRLILPLKDARTLLGFVALTEKAAGFRYTPEDLNLMGVLSNQMVTALTNARLYGESLERIRLQEEVSMARQIQIDLLPKEPPQIPGASLAAYSMPSRTVGGDFYDFLPLDDNGRIGIVIADASGKGMPAALLIAQIQAIIRSEAANRNAIDTMLCNMNKQIALSTSSEKYVTMFYAEYDPHSCILRYANAGHNYPLVVRESGEVIPLIDGGPIIGAFAEMSYQSRTIQLGSNDLLFLFTDGLSEAMDPNGQEYGEERLIRLLTHNRHLQTNEILACVMSDVASHDNSNPPQDDTTIIVLKLGARPIANHAS